MQPNRQPLSSRSPSRLVHLVVLALTGAALANCAPEDEFPGAPPVGDPIVEPELPPEPITNPAMSGNSLKGKWAGKLTGDAEPKEQVWEFSDSGNLVYLFYNGNGPVHRKELTQGTNFDHLGPGGRGVVKVQVDLVERGSGTLRIHYRTTDESSDTYLSQRLMEQHTTFALGPEGLVTNMEERAESYINGAQISGSRKVYAGVLTRKVMK